MSPSDPGLRHRNKQREETAQDLKYLGILVLAVAIASLFFFPYARDIWAGFIALVGAILVIFCAIRLTQVLGFPGLMGPAYRATSWEVRFDSGAIWTIFILIIGLALIYAAAELSVSLKPLFFGLDELF